MKIDIKKVGHTIQIAGAIYTGEGKTWLCMLPGEKLPGVDAGSVRQELVEMTLEEWQAFLHQADILEIEGSARDPKTKEIVKATLRKSGRQIDQSVSWRVYRRDGYTCRYCGANNVPLTVDHLVLWEDGGPSTEANLVAACKNCNKTRGCMPYDVWLRSPEYAKVSAGLTDWNRQLNEALVDKLEQIPRTPHDLKKSRR